MPSNRATSVVYMDITLKVVNFDVDEKRAATEVMYKLNRHREM